MLLRGGAILTPIFFLFWVYCVLDVIATDAMLVRNLNKMTWLFVVILLNVVGGLAWFVLGRPEKAGWRPGDTDYSKPSRARGLEDLPGFSSDSDRSRRASPPPEPKQQEAPLPSPDRSSTSGPNPAGGLSAEEKELLRRKHELDQREAELDRRERDLQDRDGDR
jgi:hypothetical protein